MTQYAELARAELFRLRQSTQVDALWGCASQQVDDIGEQRAVRSLVTWKGLEQLAGVVHGKREDQPIWFSSSQRGLGCGGGGGPIAQRQVREAGEHMCFHECVRGEAE